MTGKIINIEDGKVTIRIDNGQSIMIPISDVTYNNPRIGDRVSLRQNGNQWTVFKSDSPDPIRRKSSSGRKVLPAIIGVLAVAIVLIAGISVGKSSQNNTSDTVSSKQETAKSVSNTSSAAKTVSSKASSVAESVSTSSASSQSTAVQSQATDEGQQDIQIVNSGYYIERPDPSDSYYVHFAAEVKNPNKDIAASFPDLKATAKDENGTILGSQDQVGMYVMPGDTVVLSSLMDVGSKAPKTVEFSLSAQQYGSAEGMNIPTSSEFKIDNVSEVDSSFGKKVTGQITYTGSQSCNSICVTAVYKKSGKIVYSDLTFLNNPTANSPTAFEISPTAVNIPEHDTIEVSAQYWG